MGVTPRRLRQRDEEGDGPPRNEAKLYPCKQFGDWMRADWRRGLGFADDGNAYDYDTERARLTHHQANAAAMDEQRKRGEMIAAEEVRQTWSEIVAAARARLLALPSRLAGTCAGRDAAGIEAEARAIVYEGLSELARGGDGTPHETAEEQAEAATGSR
ncbi:MAG: hypothetical protein HGB02_07250 [Chlorobiaceae bacterium]|nr:hypothetical protein [Chlorobiaceae bacterium]